MSSPSKSSPASSIRFKLTLDHALTEYQKKTKKNLLEYWLASELKSSESIDDVLGILQDQAKAIEWTSAGDQRLMKRIRSSVHVLSSISDTLAGGISLAFPPAKVIFAGISVLLSAAKGVKASHDALADLFGRIEDFFKRFVVYIESSPASELLEVLAKVVVEILSILSIATKEMEQSLTKKYLKRLVGRTDIEDGLKKMNNLIQVEHGMATAQVLKVTSEIEDEVKELNLAIERMARKAGQHEWNRIREGARKWISLPEGLDPSTNHNIAGKVYHEGTATWFFGGSIFEDWMSRGSLAWIHGKPGSGKSILCSAIIRHIMALYKPGQSHLAYFYFDFRDERKQNARNLVASLILQLSAFSDTSSDVISHLYVTYENGARNPTDDDLIKCLKQMLSILAEHPVYIIMDALDECPDDSGWPKTPREEVLDVVRDLVDLPLSNLRICVTSRPEVDIIYVLNQLTIHSVSLHDQREQQKGIADYVSSVVNSDRKMRGWPEEDKKLVVKELSERADGMFRWVVCQLETLRRSVQRDVRGILSKLPKTLDETYERVLRDIHDDNKEHARRLLHCLAVAVRPLRVEELAEILTFDFDAADRDIPEHHAAWRWKDQEEAVLSTCSSLITIVEHNGGFYGPRRRVVQFSHFSVQEFLMSNRLATPIRDVSRYHILPEPAHIILAQACLGFLLHLDARIDTKLVKNFPLAKYAAEHWIAHAQFQDVASHVKYGMRDLFDPHKSHFALWVGIHDVDEPDESFYASDSERIRPSPLYYSALCGFYDLAEHLAIKFPHHVNAICGQYDSPLLAALSRGFVSVAELLLDYGENIKVQGKSGRTPLYTLLNSRKGDSETNRVVRSFLERGAEVNALDFMAWETPLHSVARLYYSSDIDIMRILLEHGADPNSMSEKGEVPLQLLIKHQIFGSRSVDCPLAAQLLLEHGADVNPRDEDRATPLHWAMGVGTSDLARILLEHGADPNSESLFGDTPLHTLLGFQPSINQPYKWDHYHNADYILVVAQLLLDRGASVNSRDNNHETPLLLAVQHETSDLMRFLLDHGADPKSENKYGKTPLHILSEPRKRDDRPLLTSVKHYPADYILVVAHLLLERGADVNARDKGHETPLVLAVRYGCSDLVRFLLEHGADPNLRNKGGKVPLHMLLGPRYDESFIVQPPDYILDIGQLLLERGADVNSWDNNHETPLLLAVRYESSDLVHFFLEHGADPDLENKDGSTPLHMLSGPRNRNKSHLLIPTDHSRADHVLLIAQLLLEHGADVNFQDSGHETPLHLAVRQKKSDLVCFLLEHGAKPNMENSEGNTPLHTLLLERYNDSGNDVLILRLLLKHGADAGARNKNHATPLDLAPYYRRVPRVLIAQVLLGHANGLKYRDVGVNAQDEDHAARLRLACFCGRLDIVQGLLSHGANVNSGNFRGENALHVLSRGEYDSQEDSVSIVQEILVRGVHVNAQCKRHRTALHLALCHGKFEIARVLLDHGAKPNVEDVQGETPLHLLSRNKYFSQNDGVSVARLLIKCGTDVNARDMKDRTPLHHASYNGLLAIVQELFEHGGNPNARNRYGETPLHLALHGKDDVGITRLLLEHGADVYAQDQNSATPLHLSSRLRKPKIAKILLDHRKTRASSRRADTHREVTSKRIRLDPTLRFAEMRGVNSHDDRMEL